MNRQQGDIFLQYQKGELSREEATDKILHRALKSRRRLFNYDDDDDDDDVQGAKVEKESEDDEFCDSSDVWLSEDRRERDLIRKNIQTNKVLDLIANTTPNVAQQAQTPTVAQQADMYKLRTTAERKPTQRFTPSTYNQQQKTKGRKRVGVKKEEDAKLSKQKLKKKKKIKYELCNIIKLWQRKKMNKMTKVMSSSPSIPKHKLKKCNAKFGMLGKSVRSMLPKFQMCHSAVTSFKLCRLR